MKRSPCASRRAALPRNLASRASIRTRLRSPKPPESAARAPRRVEKSTARGAPRSLLNAVVYANAYETPAGDEQRARRESARVREPIALVRKGGGQARAAAGAVSLLPLTPFRVAQNWRPAVTDIIGARR